MNGKQKRLKMVVGVLSVLVASFVLVGGVAAYHGAGPVARNTTPGMRFESYMDALDEDQQSTFDLAWEPKGLRARVLTGTGARFRQYLDALDEDQRSTFQVAWIPE